ncbi:MAG: DUF1573 domain-containing protein, partial [Flavobacteriales bacterium]|nr:DUF1573 domain-containing protein [Flavobacteriales bacterium]
DIWTAELKDGKAIDVRPLGPPVNTPGNETTPWFDATTGTLWFSSDFHAGLGGYDIFHARRDGGGFSTPVNAGAPINSSANDLYPALYPERGEGWLTSNRKGSFAAKGETCCNDIYRFHGVLEPVAQDTLPTADVEHTGSSMLPASSTPTAALLHLQNEFPLKLYFHNDEPEPRTRLKTTRQSYGNTYTAYKKIFTTYRAENDDPAGIEAFFTNEAEAGRAKLDALVQALIPALESGARITLDVRGHASPLAKNDYNQHLSLRRIESLRNHLYAAEGGRMKAYLDSTATNGGVLRLRVLPFGEELSATGVSDDIRDLKRSVYSAEAARERRIEVERFHIGEAMVPLERTMRYSIGTVRQGVPQDFEIPVVNNGDAALHIIRGRTSCDCLLVRSTPPPIPPGGMGIIHLHYSGRTRPGALERVVELEIEGSPSPFELTVQGTVIE